MNKITITLTEDQANYLSQLLLIEKFGLEILAKEKPHLGYLSKNLAFAQRIRTKLRKARVSNNS